MRGFIAGSVFGAMTLDEIIRMEAKQSEWLNSVGNFSEDVARDLWRFREMERGVAPISQ